MKFYYYSYFTEEEPKAQRGWIACPGHTTRKSWWLNWNPGGWLQSMPSCSQQKISDMPPWSLPLQQYHPGLSTAQHSLSPQIFPLKPTLDLWSIPTYIFNSIPFLFSVYTILILYCVKISWSPQDTLLCPLRGAPYFWNLVKKFILLYLRGFSVCLFLALVLLLKPMELNVINDGDDTLSLYFHERKP